MGPVPVDDEVLRLIARKKKAEMKRRMKVVDLFAETRAENIDAKEKRAAHRGLTAQERFEDSIIKRDGHWIWEGKFSHTGYPYLLAPNKDGLWRQVGAARFAFGEIPHRKKIRRTCDETNCVNPDHHELIKPKKRRSPKKRQPGKAKVKELSPLRTPVGEEMVARVAKVPPGAKLLVARRTSKTPGLHGLSDDDVRYIRARYAEKGISYKSLAEMFDVHWKVISEIVLRRTFRDVT